jgi:ABC-type amino acid transport substrate-binding protein
MPGTHFVPATPGTLIVATAFLPAPGFWDGTPRVSGFEAALAKELAEGLKLKAVAVKQVPFTALAAGELGGADIALSQLAGR